MTRSPHGRSAVSGAVVLGLTSTIGAGVFLGLAPAASISGRWFVPAAAIAALAALCSAFSTADQARGHPHAGGGYGYIRAQLGPWPARMGASAYLLGRAGVAAAVAGMAATYAFPENRMLVALLVLACGGVLSATGVRLGTGALRVAAAVVVVVLVLVVAVCFGVAPPPAPAVLPGSDDFTAFMGAAAVLFVAFTGFERVTAPFRDDPVHSVRTQRWAVPLLLALVLGLTLAVAAAVRYQLGAARLALSPAPLRDALLAADGGWLVPLVQLGALVAALSVLTSVFAGSRRALGAMAAAGDVPGRLAPVRGGREPWQVDVLAGVAASIVLLLAPPATALAIGACGTLFYYAFTNASARLLLQEERTWPMRTACFGLGLSVLLAMSSPVDALVTTFATMAIGTVLLGLCARIAARRRAAAALVPPRESRTSDSRDGDFLLRD
ncbi:APC family permease [Umezawaea sp. Da 62-37]|uniref:APC family permease n=1 Tax=Umezawaea sp. Da 62-37 TaxID=3075927 RepID=UPI0028F6D2FE|nr:APC family permease [Umezawaea sp. Da 62-37]WNV83521.1 APC family permease [Umezawaea sp. Da 62-37]